jgi:hypothetical protein
MMKFVLHVATHRHDPSIYIIYPIAKKYEVEKNIATSFCFASAPAFAFC